MPYCFLVLIHSSLLSFFQGEMVERIDANVEDTTMNVNAAHMQLMKYYNGLSSNRGLIIKVFATVLIFLFIWVFLA